MMSRVLLLLACLLAGLAAMGAAGCDQGIGMSVPSSTARWGGPGPDVMVGGGPR
jgi:hypothetical protein